MATNDSISPAPESQQSRRLALIVLVLIGGMAIWAVRYVVRIGKQILMPEVVCGVSFIFETSARPKIEDQMQESLRLLNSPETVQSALNSDAVKKLPLISERRNPESWLSRNMRVEVDENRVWLRLSVSSGNVDQAIVLLDELVESWSTAINNKFQGAVTISSNGAQRQKSRWY